MSTKTFQVLYNGNHGLGFIFPSAGSVKTSFSPGDKIVSVIDLTDQINFDQVVLTDTGQVLQISSSDLSLSKFLVTFSREVQD